MYINHCLYGLFANAVELVAYSTQSQYGQDSLQIVTTMDLFWITITILIAGLMHFFGFNLLGRIYQQVLCWRRGKGYMEEVRSNTHL